MTTHELHLRMALADLDKARGACIAAMEDAHAFADVKVAAAAELRRINAARLDLTGQLEAIETERQTRAATGLW